MDKLISEKELRDRFKVFGSYYNIISKKAIIPCRNVLDIYDIDFTIESYELYYHKPDALFIMMNPGKSEPSPDISIPDFTLGDDIGSRILGNRMIPTQDPDRTQFQIMRVMIEKKLWKHVRVINLSDLREPDKDNFFKKMNSFERKYHTDIHSIFSNLRTNELSYALSGINDKPIVVAWGKDNRLIDLAKKGINLLPQSNIVGVSANLYSHASPRLITDKIQWINEILELL